MSEASIKMPEECSIISFLDEIVLFREDFIVCVNKKGEGAKLRLAVLKAFEIMVVEADDLDDAIPMLAMDETFDMIIMKVEALQSVVEEVHMDERKIYLKNE